MINKEREKYDIKESDEEISEMSKYRFKRIVDKKVNSFSFQYLKEKASTHEKSLKIFRNIETQSSLKRQPY